MKRLLMRAVIGLCVVSPAFADAPPNLCGNGEHVYFTCETASRGRIVSLCGRTDGAKASGWLQYRFGRRGAIELEFPAVRDGSLQRFRYYHYFRALVDRTGVTFDNGAYTYSLFDHHEGDVEPAEDLSGVEITKAGSDTEPVRILCRMPVVSGLAALEDALPCDRENALGMCPE